MNNFKHKIESEWPFFAGLISFLMLGAAHAFEEFGKLYPCILCLHQRETYWVAILISACAVVLRHFIANANLSRAFDALLAVTFFAGAVIAGFHAGVEQHWWAGLAGCSGAGSTEISEDLLSALTKSMDVPRCDDIAWSLFGLSMAVWNMIINLALAIFSAVCALRGDTGSAQFTPNKIS